MSTMARFVKGALTLNRALVQKRDAAVQGTYTSSATTLDSRFITVPFVAKPSPLRATDSPDPRRLNIVRDGAAIAIDSGDVRMRSAIGRFNRTGRIELAGSNWLG
jgi:hypothetical protein